MKVFRNKTLRLVFASNGELRSGDELGRVGLGGGCKTDSVNKNAISFGMQG